MKRNYIVFLLLFIPIFHSCEKDDRSKIILGDKIFLRTEMASNGVNLSWNQPYVKGFREYRVYSVIIDENDQGSYYYPIAQINEFNTVSFRDSTFSLANTLRYRVDAIGDNSIVQSNISYIHTGLNVLSIFPTDALLIESLHSIFIRDDVSNRLYKYDYENNRLTDSIDINPGSGFMDINDNGFGIEIYLPNGIDKILIYKAEDLSLADIINVGLHVSSVATNGKGLLAASVSPSPSYDDPLRIYDRSTKDLISAGGDRDRTRLQFVPGSNDIFEISMNIYPVHVERYNVDEAGMILSRQDDPYHGDHPLSPYIFKISPDGMRFITSSYGALYASTTMTYSGQCTPNGNWYNDFCFEPEADYIYGANVDTKAIDIISDDSGLKVQSSMYMYGYPAFLFRTGSQIISLNTISPIYRDQPYYLRRKGIAIEKIDLD